MSKYTSMTPAEFEAKKGRLVKLSVQVNQLAKLILVYGLSNSKAAEELGMSKQNVAKHMNRVIALLNDMPADYVFVQEWMPQSLAIETRAKIRADLEARKNKA